MGNNTSKDSGNGGRQRRSIIVEGEAGASDPQVPTIYGPGNSSRRGSRHEIPFLHRSSDTQTPQRPKETRQEKDARRAEGERQARLKERERSVREESVDGGFLVTLGTYTGAEDFSKPIVRQLQIERRLAPFWKGLNDHSDSWTEHQLVAAVRGLPIPAADEIPEGADLSPLEPETSSLAVPTPYLQPAEALSSPSLMSSSAPLTPVGSSPFFRGRSKTLASLTGSKTTLPDLTPQEVQLPHDSNVNGLPIEAYLYREPGECPICFLYYPPYLNRTRCCDQPICSECFVQIKRPDPHPPEHEQPGQQRTPEEEAGLLVSEVAACPFCVAPEFGITYEAPPFRRGLTYATHANGRMALSATSSQTSIQSGERRRNISISASAPEVVTTDKVRPDWAKKLADARAHVLRRSTAATALHNAAYVLGNQEGLFRGAYGRRRRSIFIDSPAGSGSQTPGEGAAGADLFPGRTSSRRNRVDDLEDLMMMEAIRLSLAAEEERKRKEDKEKAKEDKKKAKESKKEAKQLEKLAKKHGSTTSLYNTHSNDSTSTWATSSMVRSSSNLGSQLAVPEEVQGKGKAPMQDSQGVIRSRSGSSVGDAQRHLEESRASIQPAPSNPIPMQRRGHPRQLSNASSMASSLVDSAPGSYRAESPSPSGSGYEHDDTYQTGTPAIEPLLNFRSLAAMIDSETKGSSSEHVEHAVGSLSKVETLKEPSPAGSPTASITFEGGRQRGDSGESSAGRDAVVPFQESEKHRPADEKKNDVQVLEREHLREATQ